MARKTKDGKWIDSAGNEIPAKYVDKVDKKRDRVVTKLCQQAEKISEKLREFKRKALNEIENYFNWIAEENGVEARTKKGNKWLYDFSRDYRIEIKMAEHIDFDERLQLAREIIANCIKRWSENSDDRIRLLVEDAFKVDKKGRIDKNRIIGLTRLQIKDKEWQKAMKLIKESIQVVGRKAYIKFWKNVDGEWKSIPLDIADF